MFGSYRSSAFVTADGVSRSIRTENSKVILVPTELLNDLPVALDWSEIDEVARVNDEVRREWSKVFKSALKAKKNADEIRDPPHAPES